MPLAKGKSEKAFKQNVRTEMHAGKSQKQSLAIAYAMKRRQKMAKGGVAFECPVCLSENGDRCPDHAGRKADASAEGHLDNEAAPHALEPHGSESFDDDRMLDIPEPHYNDETSGSPTMDAAVRADRTDDSPAAMVMRRRKNNGSDVAKLAKGGYVDSSEDDIALMHDYSMFPDGKDDSTTGEHHDSDMPDQAQANSLVGQIMAKRRKLKK